MKATIYITAYQNIEQFDNRFAATRAGYVEITRTIREVVEIADGVFEGIALIGGRRIPVIAEYEPTLFEIVD